MTDFQKLWVGQAVSVFGSLITRTALPWCALLFLRARALDMALLVLADLLPGFLLGLFAGAWLDRRAKRPVMIACDVLRFLLVMSIPALALTGKLTLGSLFAVAPLMGILSTVFDIAYQSYLPELVQGEALGRANSRLSASAAVAEVCAFSVSGWLVQHFGGPQALLIDAATFLLSALSLAWIRKPISPCSLAGEGAGGRGNPGERQSGGWAFPGSYRGPALCGAATSAEPSDPTLHDPNSCVGAKISGNGLRGRRRDFPARSNFCGPSGPAFRGVPPISSSPTLGGRSLRYTRPPCASSSHQRSC